MWRRRTGSGVQVRSALFFSVVIFSLACMGASSGREPPVRVQPGESIQAAINAAPTGTTIHLEAGSFEENLIIEKSLTLRGPEVGEAVLRSVKESAPVVWIWAPEEGVQTVSVRLEGLSIGGASGYDPHWPDRGAYGVLAQDNVSVEITDCTISENGLSGIVLFDVAEVIVSQSTLSENGGYGIWLRDATTATIS